MYEQLNVEIWMYLSGTRGAFIAGRSDAVATKPATVLGGCKIDRT